MKVDTLNKILSNEKVAKAWLSEMKAQEQRRLEELPQGQREEIARANTKFLATEKRYLKEIREALDLAQDTDEQKDYRYHRKLVAELGKVRDAYCDHLQSIRSLT